MMESYDLLCDYSHGLKRAFSLFRLCKSSMRVVTPFLRTMDKNCFWKLATMLVPSMVVWFTIQRRVSI